MESTSQSQDGFKTYFYKMSRVFSSDSQKCVVSVADVKLNDSVVDLKVMYTVYMPMCSAVLLHSFNGFVP